MMNEKHTEKLNKLLKRIEILYERDPAIALTVICQSSDHAKRICRRLERSSEYERVEFVQMKGPTIGFNGQQLYQNANEEYSTEFWLTDKDDWVVLYESPTTQRAYTFIGEERLPEQVMAAMGWGSNARNMAKSLGWSLHREVV